MEKVLSLSLGEMALKGLNRRYFEDKLKENVKKAIKDIGFQEMHMEQGKLYISGNADDYDKIIKRVRNVFGIAHISKCTKTIRELDNIKEAVLEHVKENFADKDKKYSFKLMINRSNKTFPIKSPELAAIIGGFVLDNFPNFNVDVIKPDVSIYVDIKGCAYIYTEKIQGSRGMPVGTAGTGMLLLSGGIDSPVAGYMMAKRGLKISAVHFHSYPFTSLRAEEKVLDLANILSRYAGKIKITSINLLDIQTAIHENCPAKEITILSRRFMMRIAERIAISENAGALITGESLGQVASQTLESLGVTNQSVSMPVFRPLVGMDKVEIIDIAKEIESFETSIQPYEDCCTLFLPKHPVTKPVLERILKSEENLDIEFLISDSIEKKKVHFTE